MYIGITLSSHNCRSDRAFVVVPLLLQRGDFCLLPPIPTSPVLVEALRTGCIPVVLKNSRVLPFAEGIDWTALVTV